MNETLDKAGILKESYNVEDAQAAMDQLASKYGESLHTYGMSKSSGLTSEEQARVNKFIAAGADLRTGAVLAAMDPHGALLDWQEKVGPKMAADAVELQKATGGVARGLGTFLARKGITTPEGISKSISQGLRGKGVVGGLGDRARIEAIKQRSGVSLIDAEGGGAPDAQLERQLKNLDREEQVLLRFAATADSFARATSGLETAIRAAQPAPPIPPKADEVP